MKRLNIFTTLSLLLLGLSATDASAQSTRRVEVSKAYAPEVSVATKLVAPTDIEMSSIESDDITYDIRPDTWRTVLNAYDYKPATATYWDFNRSTPFHIHASAGYPLSSDVEARYIMQSSKVGYFGVGITHSGDFAARNSAEGVKRKIGNSFSMNNGVDLMGAVIFDNRILEATASYDYDIFNRYAEIATPARLHFHDANLSVRFGDSFANLKRLNFLVEAHTGYWHHRLPSSLDDISAYGEFNVGAEATLARIFKKSRVDITATYDMWRGGAIYGDMRFGVDVGYARRFKFVNVEVGIGYMYDKVSGCGRASHHFLPHAKALFDLKIDAFTPYIEVDTKVGQNGVASLYKRNPYIDFGYMSSIFANTPNDLSYNLTAGFLGNVNTRFAYRVYAGANFVRDYLTFYINREGVFAVATDSNIRLVYGAELEYLPIGGLRLGASIFGYWDDGSMKYVDNKPTFEADLFAEYTLRRWKFHITSDFIGTRRWTSIIDDTIYSDKTKVDLGVGVSFDVTNDINIYLEGNNLLNSKIYDYAYYYRSGIGVQAGVKIDF